MGIAYCSGDDSHTRKQEDSERNRNYPLSYLVDFYQDTLKDQKLRSTYRLYDPFNIGASFEEENFDKICFHFTLAQPSRCRFIGKKEIKVSGFKGETSLYHWFNLYIFLDRTTVKSELDWDIHRVGKRTKLPLIEENIRTGVFPEFMEVLKKKGAVLVQDLYDEKTYPRDSTLLVITKNMLHQKLKENPLCGMKYDFTSTNNCQRWVELENESLGLSSNFSAKFVNEFFNSSKAMKIIGKLIKRTVVDSLNFFNEGDYDTAEEDLEDDSAGEKLERKSGKGRDNVVEENSQQGKFDDEEDVIFGDIKLKKKGTCKNIKNRNN